MSKDTPSAGVIEHAAVRDATPSAQVVYLTLKLEGQMTQKAILDEVGIAESSVRDALTDLTEMGVVETTPRPGDARQDWYTLADVKNNGR